MSYSSDSNGMIMYSWEPGNGRYGRIYWPPFISGLQGPSSVSSTSPSAAAGGTEYVQAGPIFICPTMKKYYRMGGVSGYNSERAGYGMPWNTNADFAKSWRPGGSGTMPLLRGFIMGKIKQPSETILLADAAANKSDRRASTTSYFDPRNRWAQYYPRVHLAHGTGLANLLFFDNHVNSMDAFSINDLPMPFRPKYFWNKDLANLNDGFELE